MRLVPDQRLVEQFLAAGLDRPFHDRVHAGYPDTAEHHSDAGVGEDRVEQRRVLPVTIPDQVLHSASGIVEVHEQVPGLYRSKTGFRGLNCGTPSGAAAGCITDGHGVSVRRARTGRSP
jgi:hypothetical protein